MKIWRLLWKSPTSLWLVCLGWLAAGGSAGFAQPTSPPSQDPMMALMLSQPRLETGMPIIATASFDPPVVKPGEVSVYRVVVNALEASIRSPERLETPPQLNVKPGARGQVLQMAGTNMQPRTSFNYHVRASQPGAFSIPGFTVEVQGQKIPVPSAELKVSGGASGFPPTQLLKLEILASNVFVGQPVLARIQLPGSAGGIVQGLAQVQLTGQGFLVDQTSARQRIEGGGQVGAIAPTYIYEVLLTPITAGRLSLLAQGFTVGSRFAGSISITGPAIIHSGQPQYTLVDSETIEFPVRPLPRSGELPGFTGAVGRFALEPPTLSTNVSEVGNPIKLSVKVRGDGNLARLVAPPPPKADGWQILASPADATPPQVIQAQGFKVLNYTLIPLNPDARSTPPIPFSYFDPKRAAYTDLTIPGVDITLRPNATGVGDSEAFQLAEAANQPREKELALSGLASNRGITAATLVPVQSQGWFPVIQVVPGLAFLGLYAWDRRRRYLEQHPEVVLRQRARKGLRRWRKALGKAVRKGDGAAFVTAAANALREGCAPHYAAEPAALVLADILPALPESVSRSGQGELIQRVFTLSDAARFGNARVDGSQLFPARKDLEQVLEKIEEGL